MGARIPPSQRPRRGGLNCEFCGRPAASIEALQSHLNTLHFHALKEKKKRAAASTPKFMVKKPGTRKLISKKIAFKAASKVKLGLGERKLILKKIARKAASRENALTRASKKERSSKAAKPKSKAVNFNLKIDKMDESAIEKKQDTLKQPPTVEYRCPKCDKTFMVRFIALKHIQKHHCVNSKDEEVPKDSPDLIQPILLEFCPQCKVKLPMPHDCPLQAKPPTTVWYKCSECQQKYKNTVLFTKHIEDEHQDKIQRMEFPTDDEFQAWKKQMEAQTECSYVIMQKANKKQSYYCSEFIESGLDGNPQFCPSTIITAHNNNVNVTYYPHHYGHTHKKYTLAEEFKQYMSSKPKEIEDKIKEVSDNEDLYIKFKNLLDTIVFDAAKINKSTLKHLIKKAKEMDNIISKYNEDDDFFPSSLPANTISLSTSRDGDEVYDEPLQTRKRSSEVNSPIAKKKKGPIRRSDTFSLADDKDSEKILKELDEPNKSIVSRKDLESPSFNDSYKEFIDKNILPKAESKTKTLLNVNKKSMNPIKANNKTKKKQVVKTKIGIFKPSLSPKKVDRRISRSISIPKDIEYEVREQENDCNILVLKI